MATILFLAHRIPYPPNKGDKIRSWHFLAYLLRHHRVHLACFIDDAEDIQYLEKLNDDCASVKAVVRQGLKSKIHGLTGVMTGTTITRASYRSREIDDYVDDLLQGDDRPDLIYCFSAGMMQFTEKYAARVPVLFDMVDVDSAKWQSYAADSGFPLSWIYRREAQLLRQEENQAIDQSYGTFLVSRDEALLCQNRYHGSRAETIHSLKNGVDYDYFDPDFTPKQSVQSTDLIFTGAMDYRPNIEAILWFIGSVWPQIKAEKPSVTLAIVGGNPSQDILKLADDPAITVTGFVDESRAWIQAARLVIAPLKIARGVQNKVLEGMAMAKPVVATTEAYTGIDAPVDKNAPAGQCLSVCDDASDFAQETLRLLGDTQQAAAMGQAARTWIKDNQSWDSQYDVLQEYIDRALSPVGKG